MPPEESLYPPDWLRIAEKDLNRVQRLLNDADPEAAGFYLQQALEKFIKACLLSHGWKLKRTHDLDALLSELVQYLPETEIYRKSCQQVVNFYFAERYPLMLDSGLQLEDVANAVQESDGLIQIIRRQLAARSFE